MGLIRLFLAGVVEVDHWRVLMPAFTDDHMKFGFNAGYTVPFSNMISGFLFAFSLQRNYTPGLDGIACFYRSRPDLLPLLADGPSVVSHRRIA